jgi:hypothetical protein
MIAITAVVALVVLAFLLNSSFNGSELIITILVLFVLFFCILHVYYVNTDSSPADLYNENTKKLKRKQNLNDAFDAILNKNNSSLE